MAPHVFKVKLASRETAAKVSKIMDNSHSSNGMLDNLQQAGFKDCGLPWIWDKHNNLDKRDKVFDKMEGKLLTTLSKDGFLYSHMDENGFDVYVQAEKTKQGTLGLGL
jgi:hypothetical protein